MYKCACAHAFDSAGDEFLAPVRLVVSGWSCEGEASL